MEVINKFSLTVDSQETNKEFVKSVVSSFLSQTNATVEDVNDIGAAVEETISNCISHAYPHFPGKIYISVTLHQYGHIAIKIRDNGVGIENIAQAMEPLYTSKNGVGHSGLGFSVMESFCDKVYVKSSPGKGTTVFLRKKISI